MTYLCNALSLSMLGEASHAQVDVCRLDDETAREAAREAMSAVGHEDTARLFASVLGRQVVANRVNVVLRPGDVLVVGQYGGPRLEPGTTQLPPGATLRWYRVSLSPEVP